ncbi:MAG: hypothetical protein K5877_01545, partial [Lachnospiraceae bacterium]|nr:hypothetical protein [Lachnospiraceae bacterium]
GKCSGKLVKNFKITGKYVLTEGAELSVIPESESYEYTGNAIKPNVKVVARIKKNDGSVETKTLRVGVDYALSYKNNKDVAAVNAVKNGKDIAPQIIIKGKGSYALGSDKNVGITKKFSIDKAKVENLFITAGDVTYNKKANAYQKTKISFADNGNISRKLAVNKDYKISFKTVGDTQVPEVGQTVMAKIEGIGVNYTGVASVSYRIIDPKKDTDISKAKAIINADAKGKTQPCIYTGKAIEPGKKGQPTLKITVGSGKNLKTLTEGKDFEIVGYLNNIEKGSKAVIIVRGIGECKGIKSFNFKIDQSDVKNVWGGIYK